MEADTKQAEPDKKPEKEKKKKVKVKSTDLPVIGCSFMELVEKDVQDMFEQEVGTSIF